MVESPAVIAELSDSVQEQELMMPVIVVSMGLVQLSSVQFLLLRYQPLLAVVHHDCKLVPAAVLRHLSVGHHCLLCGSPLMRLLLTEFEVLAPWSAWSAETEKLVHSPDGASGIGRSVTDDGKNSSS